jgi:tRNA-Thr(GGU) m(6)t(6)A37 methyltransferase TsaA
MPECDWHKTESRLVFLDEYVDGLYRLKECKRVWVIFGLHHYRGWESRVRPRRAEDNSLVGVFASRASRRPNRLGLTLVDLIDVRGRIVTVTGLDAFDGTPVYDMKNFDADYDT